MTAAWLWSADAMARAMGAERAGALPPGVSGLSIDTRTLEQGDAFFAIKGDSRDGHEFVAAASERGAGLAVVAEARRGEFPHDASLLVVPDVLDGLVALARAARVRSDAQIVAVTGSVGKTSTKEALRVALSRDGETHASAASYNNHWGVPLSLARLPETARFGVFEIGMNHAGEITPLTKLACPHVAIVTTVEPVHLEHFDSVEAIADAKGEIFCGLEPGGAAVINRDNPHWRRLAGHAETAGARVVFFGEHADAQARLLRVALRPEGSFVEAEILGSPVAYRLGVPGRHLVQNSLAVLAAARLLGADLALAALALATIEPPAGRGARTELALGSGTALLIDESYNANPASMRAALALLGQTPLVGRGRRIAALGDMLELGPQAPALHSALAAGIEENEVDLVFCAGPLMRALWDALPPERRGAYAESAAELQPRLLDAIANGDVVMIKGSNGSRMGPIAKALRTRYAPAEPRETADAQG